MPWVPWGSFRRLRGEPDLGHSRPAYDFQYVHDHLILRGPVPAHDNGQVRDLCLELIEACLELFLADRNCVQEHLSLVANRNRLRLGHPQVWGLLAGTRKIYLQALHPRSGLLVNLMRQSHRDKFAKFRKPAGDLSHHRYLEKILTKWFGEFTYLLLSFNNNSLIFNTKRA